MVDKKSDDSITIAYIFGVMSIVMAFFTPLAGLIFGILGFIQSKKQKTNLAEKAKKLNLIGMVLSIILFAIKMALTIYLTTKGINSLQNFPVI